MSDEPKRPGEKILFREESYAIQGAVFEVYRELGSGFLEAVYQECLAREFQSRSIPFEAQKDLPLVYKGDLLKQVYRPDFVCYGSIIVEIKAVKDLMSEHKAQMLNYLRTAQVKLGLLVNFGHYPKAQIERLVS